MWNPLHSAWLQYVHPILDQGPLPQHVVVNLEQAEYERYPELDVEFALHDGFFNKKLLGAVVGMVKPCNTIIVTRDDLDEGVLTLAKIDELVEQIGLEHTIVELRCSPSLAMMISRKLNAATPYVDGLFHANLSRVLDLRDRPYGRTTTLFETTCLPSECEPLIATSLHLHVNTASRNLLSPRHRSMVMEEMDVRGFPTKYFLYIQPITTVAVNAWNYKKVRNEIEKLLGVVRHTCFPEVISVSIEGDVFAGYVVGDALQECVIPSVVCFDYNNDMAVVL